MRSDRAIGLELRDGHDIGRDPRGMTADELAVVGHVRMSAQQALRLRCIDCSGASAAAGGEALRRPAQATGEPP